MYKDLIRRYDFTGTYFTVNSGFPLDCLHTQSIGLVGEVP